MIMKKDEKKLSWWTKLCIRRFGREPVNEPERCYALDIWNLEKVKSLRNDFINKLGIAELKVLLKPQNKSKLREIKSRIPFWRVPELLDETDDKDIFDALLSLNFHGCSESIKDEVEDFVIENYEKCMETYAIYNNLSSEKVIKLIEENKIDALFLYIYHHRGKARDVYYEIITKRIKRLYPECFNRLYDLYLQKAKNGVSKYAYYPDDIILEIIKRGNTDDILLLLDKGDVLDEEKTELLLNSENSEAVLAYIKLISSINGGICLKDNDIGLIKPCYKDALKIYLSYSTLSADADIELAKMNDEELLLIYFNLLARKGFHPYDRASEIIFSLGRLELKHAYVDKLGLPYFAERQLITNGRYMDIDAVSYIENYILYPSCEILLIQNYPFEVVKSYLEQINIAENAEAVLLKSGSNELFDWYIENHPSLHKNNFSLFIKRANHEQLRKWLPINEDNLSCQDMVEVMKLGDNTLTHLIKVDNNAENEFVETASKKAILTYISEFLLCEEAEKTLIKKADEDLILALMANDGFYDENDKLLLELYIDGKISDNVMMRYVDMYAFCDKVEKILFETIHSCAELKEFYITRYALSTEALISLLKADKVGDLILLHIEKGSFDSIEAETLLWEHPNKNLWQAYIERWNPSDAVQRKVLNL